MYPPPPGQLTPLQPGVLDLLSQRSPPTQDHRNAQGLPRATLGLQEPSATLKAMLPFLLCCPHSMTGQGPGTHCRKDSRASADPLLFHLQGRFHHQLHRGGLSTGTSGGSPPGCFPSSCFLSNLDPLSLLLRGSLLTGEKAHFLPFSSPFT